MTAKYSFFWGIIFTLHFGTGLSHLNAATTPPPLSQEAAASTHTAIVDGGVSDEKPEKERGKFGRTIQFIGVVLVWISLIITLLFLIEGFLFYTPVIAAQLFWPTIGVSLAGGVLYLIGRFAEGIAKLFGSKDASFFSGKIANWLKGILRKLPANWPNS